MAETDTIEHVYLISAGVEVTITHHEKEVVLNKVKLGKRDPKGVKVRV